MENILENVLSEIISEKYEAYYQPQYNNFTQEITGFEALARLNDPDGVVSPAKFISALERKGKIVELDLFIFDSACKFIKKCKDNNISVKPVCVNFSSHDFYKDNFIDEVEAIRKKYGVDAKIIGIELEDKLAAKSKDNAIEIINQFHRYGYTVLLDNFDGNDPSLSFVKEIGYDIVKFDIVKLNKKIKGDNSKLIASIVNTAKKNNISMIVQGVETEEELNFLMSKGSEFAQGYIYARPMDEKSAFDRLIQPTNYSVTSAREKKTYKDKFEHLLEQLDIYYWEYRVDTKELYPCYRSIRDFGLTEVVKNFPEAINDSNILSKEHVKTCYNLYKEIDKGAKHIERIIRMGPNLDKFYVRCDTEFDNNGKPLYARGSAMRIVDSNDKDRNLFKFLKK